MFNRRSVKRQNIRQPNTREQIKNCKQCYQRKKISEKNLVLASYTRMEALFPLVIRFALIIDISPENYVQNLQLSLVELCEFT